MAENEKNNKKGKASVNTDQKAVKKESKTTKPVNVSKKTNKTNKTNTSKTNTAKKTNTSKTNTAKKTNSSKTNTAKKTNVSKTNAKVKSVNKKVNKEDSKVNLTEEVKTEDKNIKEKKANIKQARRQLYYSANEEGNEFSKLIKIVLAVTAIIVVFYGVTVVVTDKAKEAAKEANSEKTDIQYDSIVIGSMLNINGSFYVLIENTDDIRLNEYTTMLQTIKANDDAPVIYTADLSSGFNKEYLSDESNYDSDMTKFKVTGTTLVKIDDHEIEDVYDNYDDIIEQLQELD